MQTETKNQALKNLSIKKNKNSKEPVYYKK